MYGGTRAPEEDGADDRGGDLVECAHHAVHKTVA